MTASRSGGRLRADLKVGPYDEKAPGNPHHEIPRADPHDRRAQGGVHDQKAMVGRSHDRTIAVRRAGTRTVGGWRQRTAVSRLAACLLIVLPAASLISLPAATAQPAPLFHADTRLVVLHATVTNRRGELVTGLGRDAFTVFENGRRQPITFFSRDDVPVSLGLVIDNSGSMRTLRPKVEAAALACVRASNPRDEVFVLNFADKAELDVPFTSDPRVLEAGLARVDSIGGTAMRDAVDKAERYLAERAARDRKALLVVTDGNDNESDTRIDRIVADAVQAGVTVYAIGLLGEEDAGKARHARHELEQLTTATGGLSYFPESIDQIRDVALDVARQIRNQYTLAYPPPPPLDGSYRAIRITVKGPGKLVARTRAGYRAMGSARPASGG